ncbi:MAG: hypothetical protein MJZ25_08870 [Fibrobacter sp.]|nr:hypothetical protein [Fibrobacter sp.]
MKPNLSNTAKIALADYLLDRLDKHVSYVDDDGKHYYHMDLENLEESCEACGTIAEALTAAFDAENSEVKFYYD